MTTVSVPVIRNAEDLEVATEKIARLWGAPMGTREGDELDALIAIVHAYESRHYPIPPPTPVEAVRFAMEQRGLTEQDLVPHFGSSIRVAQFLNGHRALTKTQIVALHRAYRIPYDSLLG